MIYVFQRTQKSPYLMFTSLRTVLVNRLNATSWGLFQSGTQGGIEVEPEREGKGDLVPLFYRLSHDINGGVQN